MSQKISQLSPIANAAVLPAVKFVVVDPNDNSTPPAGPGGSDKEMTIGQLPFPVDWINVAKAPYNADPTGGADATTLIQNALTAAGNAGGGTVYLPAGTFLTGPLTLPQNVTLRGAGIAATTLLLNHSTVSQFGNMIMNQQLVGASYDANCVQVRDMRLDGAKSVMPAGWWNSGIVLANRTPSGAYEYTDGRHQISNVLIQNFSGTGFVQTGRGAVQASDIQVWACGGFGFNILQDSFYANCDAGGCGIDGWLIQGGSNRLAACKSWFSGGALTSSRTTGATALTVAAPSANPWEGGSIAGGLTFSLANGFGNGFLWNNISGTATAGNYSGGTYSSLGAQDNARAGFCIIGGRHTLSAIEADSNNNCGVTSGTTGLGSYAGVDLSAANNCFSNQIEGYSWDRQANTNRQAAALAIGSGNNGNRVRLGFEGKLNDNSNMPPLTASSTINSPNSIEFVASGAGSMDAQAFATPWTPDPFYGQVKSMTLTGNVVINNPALGGTNTTGIFLLPGMRLTLILTQDATGGRTVTLGAAYRLNGESFSTAAGATTAITFFYDGTYWQAQGTAGAITRVATTGVAGFALQNGFPTIISWTAPNDGQLHSFTVFAIMDITSAETGGQVNVSFTMPNGVAAGYTIFSGGIAAGQNFNQTTQTFVTKAGSTVSVAQVTALTAGAATLWAEIWGS